MTENQKLREACNYIDALGGDSRSYRQALALPTAEQVDDINVAESFTSVTNTAAPVGERDLPPLPSYARWEERIKTLMQQCGHPNSMSIYQAFKQFQNEFEHEMIAYARAALSAGDAVDAQRTPLTVLQYNAIPELCAIPPSLYESVVRAIERAHGIDAAMRKAKL